MIKCGFKTEYFTLATRPNANKKAEKAVEKDGGFKMTADGRLIITQDEEEQGVKKSKLLIKLVKLQLE